jgi:hypothetical protein
MPKHCVHLNLNIDPVTINHNNLKNAYQTIIQLKNINPELISILHRHNITVKYAESFYSSPNFFQTIHTDNLGGDYVKLNFVYGGKGSTMNWYQVKEGIIPKKVYFTAKVSTEYIPWTIDMVDLVESDPLEYPSLVQVGCPHNVINADEYRLCISLLLRDTNLNRISIQSATTNLADLII